MSDTIENLHPNTEHTLEILHLSSFQLLGMNGYNSTLNIMDFLNNRTFLWVKRLYLRGNSLSKCMPGLQFYFTNIEYIAISYNFLIDMANCDFFSEIVAHKAIVTNNYHHQGYVGGSHITIAPNSSQPYDTYQETFNESNNILVPILFS